MNLALNSALSNFKQHNGELLIGGRTISSLAQEHGTPLYIYDRAVIKHRCQTLRGTLPENLQITYAIKANPNIEIIRTMGAYYDGFDVASQGEMEKAIDAGIYPEVISFTGPGKTINELHFAIEHNIGSISVESERELEHIQSICKTLGTSCKTLGTSARVLIRVNPAFELSQSGMKMGGGPKQFGIDSERVPALIKRIISDNLVQFDGVHIFAGSQNLNADQLLQTFKKILEYASDIRSSTGTHIKTLNMGGGFGIPYFVHEKDLDLAAVGNGLANLLNTYGEKLTGTIFKIELGRFLVGECGIYVSRILYRKISHNQVFLITDGGMHHHLAASGNFGQSLVRRPMPMTIANKLNAPLEKVHIVGPLCTPLDTFGFVELPSAEEGDFVVVLNSGAYGFSASPLQFLSHKPPKEVIV
jgi:diaminopimelate decarboxylase